jgi:HAD superfamily hydrolase (TIGR01458 family)
VSWQPLPGAVAALRQLRAADLRLALVTNTTSRPRSSIAAALAGAGFPVTAGDILTAFAIVAAYLNDHCPGARCLLLNSGQIGADLAGVTLTPAGDPAPVDVVLVGGAGPEFSYQALNRAFGCLRGGATLVAMHRGLYWRTRDGLQLDSGAFVTGLEQAAGIEAEVVGKPAAAFFATALAHLGADAAHTLMVGDDIETDVLAAQRQGLTGVLVKTGKVSAQRPPQRQRHPRPRPWLLRRPASPARTPVMTAATAKMREGTSRDRADMHADERMAINVAFSGATVRYRPAPHAGSDSRL